MSDEDNDWVPMRTSPETPLWLVAVLAVALGMIVGFVLTML